MRNPRVEEWEEKLNQLLRRVTEVAAEVTRIHKDYFFVSIHELPNENLAIGGKDVNRLLNFAPMSTGFEG